VAGDRAPGGTSTAGGPAVATSAPALGIDLRVPPTRAPRPSSATTGPAPSPNGVVSSSPSVSVTLAEDGRTITLQPGQRALLKLGGELDWSLQVDDETVLSRVAGVPVVPGAQAIFQANRVGQ